MKQGIRFSSFLMTSFVSQAAGCVLLISLCLYFYFDSRITGEFRDKLRAQQGQAELILEKRMDEVQRRLKDLSLDNTTRVTMMLGVTPQLDERIRMGYPAENGTYFFVRTGEAEEWLPRDYPGLDPELLRACLPSPGSWHPGRKAGADRLVWYFTAPVMRRTELLGTAFALYDPTEDQELATSIRHAMAEGSDLILRGPRGPVSVKNGNRLDLPAGATHLEASPGGGEHAITPLAAYPDFYFLASLAKLKQEKQKLALLLGLLSLLAMALSASLGVLIGNQMARPLKRLAAKAQEISEAKKESLFEGVSIHPEFNQLSQAFNSMITSLAEEKSRYTELLRHIGDAVYILDPEGRIVEANEATGRQLGCGARSLAGRIANDFLPSADLAFLLARLDEAADRTSRGITIRSRHLAADGRRIPVEINSRAISYGGQKVILNVARDLTSRMEAEQALRESEERYRSILENIAEGYFEIDAAGTYCFFNQAFCSLLGRSAGEVHGVAHAQVAAPESATRLTALIEAIRTTATPARLAPYTIIRPDGEERILDLSLSLIKREEGEPTGIRGMGRDITEQLRIEKEKSQLKLQLQRGLRLESLGTMAGGIAHDFNNLLAAVLGYAELSLLEKLPEEGELPLFLQRIKEVAFRGRELVAQILTFSRQDEAVRHPVNIVPVIKETLKMLAPALPAHVELRADIDAGAGLILADPTQIHQVLMNLCINGRDAMREKGGVLAVTLERTEIDDAQPRRPAMPAPGRYLRLRVGDTGIGMGSEVLERIFEPFFTTKKPNEGTGMGLAVVHGIVTHHGGEIFVSSRPDAGTCFDLYFPSIAGEEARVKDSEEPLPPLPRNCVVLLVDDEEDLVRATTRMLEHLGCRVTATTSSHEALQIFRRHPELFDLVITDQVMPELTGMELAQEILALRPELPVFLFSGYTEAVSPEEALKKGIRRFALKPLSLRDLAAILHEAVAGPPP
jgi:PAS domain S-box-containing protein